ncbi:hypothetical protein [Aeromonas rivipollensis]|uniref:hypothetical protein n=1 Tax=Aeromonas rivipollensis TaxID=948519 RepID=UPI003D21E512
MNIDLERLLELGKDASRGNWKADRNCGVSCCNIQIAATALHVDAAFIAAANPAVVTELVRTVKGSTLACIADVQAEPEFPGEVPPELIARIRQCIEDKDEQYLLHMLRRAVAITKKGIQERIASRTGTAIEGIFGQVVRDQCSCGEPISVELDCPRHTSRTDGKRPFYPDEVLPEGLDPQCYSEHGSSVFRCRKCGEPVGDTVPAARYEKPDQVAGAPSDLSWLVRETKGEWFGNSTHIARDGLEDYLWAGSSVQEMVHRYPGYHWFTKEQYLEFKAEMLNKPSLKVQL